MKIKLKEGRYSITTQRKSGPHGIYPAFHNHGSTIKGRENAKKKADALKKTGMFSQVQMTHWKNKDADHYDNIRKLQAKYNNEYRSNKNSARRNERGVEGAKTPQKVKVRRDIYGKRVYEGKTLDEIKHMVTSSRFPGNTRYHGIPHDDEEGAKKSASYVKKSGRFNNVSVKKVSNRDASSIRAWKKDLVKQVNQRRNEKKTQREMIAQRKNMTPKQKADRIRKVSRIRGFKNERRYNDPTPQEHRKIAFNNASQDIFNHFMRAAEKHVRKPKTRTVSRARQAYNAEKGYLKLKGLTKRDFGFTEAARPINFGKQTRSGLRKPKRGTPEWHQHRIAVDTVKNPFKSFLGGPNAQEAEITLRKHFGYQDHHIAKLKR